jgi:hypothetical protein
MLPDRSRTSTTSRGRGRADPCGGTRVRVKQPCSCILIVASTVQRAARDVAGATTSGNRNVTSPSA